jgi:hypothetical protein
VRIDARTMLCRRWWRRLSQDSIDPDRRQARNTMVRLARPEVRRLTWAKLRNTFLQIYKKEY